MSRKFTSISLAALAFALAAPLSAVAQTAAQRVIPEIAKVAPAKRAKMQADWLKQHPLVGERKTLRRSSSAFATAFTPGARFNPVTPSAPALRHSPLLADKNVTLWGNLAYDTGWSSSNAPYGYYSFSATAPLSYTMLSAKAQTEAIAQYGTSYADGHIRSVAVDMSWAAWGYIFATLYDTDTDTWESTGTAIDDYSLIATETAQAEDGTVYGEFYSADLSSFEIGVVDYAAKTRTTIGTAARTYVAMGVTKAGVLYGIGVDGNLYKISTSTGEETLVGSTGLTLRGSDGYYGQTGEIDPKDDTFYWFSIDANGVTAVYAVDLQTAALTKLADGGEAQFYGMLIPAPAAADGAPAKLTDLAAKFEGASLTGTLTFTAPTTTYAGEALSGELSYTVTENGTVVASGTTTAGAAVATTVTVAESGIHKFVVSTKNAVGESPKANVSVWAGLDVPGPVSALAFTVDDNNLATVTWAAPTEGTHAGYIGDITYDVYRIAGSDTVEVAKDLAATTVTDQLDGSSLNYYVYLVYAKNSEFTSAGATSDGLLVGSALQPDWTENFLSENSINFFTIIDGNADGRTWKYESQTVRSNYNGSQGNDDWLITPPIHLKADRLYTFSYSARNQSSSWINSMEVKYGTAATAEAMTHTLAETFEPVGGEAYTDYSYEVKVDAEGDYYFGFHDNTAEADRYYIRIKEISLKADAMLSAPDSVTGLKAVPAALGELKATISLTAPTKAVNGTVLTALDSIVVSRNGKAVKTFAQPAPGAALSFEDAVDVKGTYTYSAVTYMNNEFGRTATTTAYIGKDTPEAPAVTLADNVTNILATWPLVSTVGVNGGYIDPTKVSVAIYDVVSSGWGYALGDQLVASEPGATSATLDIDPEVSVTTSGKQSLLQYYAAATCDNDTSSYAGTGAVVVGPTLPIPFHESLAGGSLENGFAWVTYNDASYNRRTAASWDLGNDPTVDNDGGAFVWVPYTEYGTAYTIESGDECSINMPKIKLIGATNPQLLFSLYSNAREKAKLKVVILLPDGTESEAAVYDLSKKAKTGWESKKVDLSAYESERYITIRFLGISEGDDTYMAIDGIDVLDQLDHNITAQSISVPAKVTAGSKGKVSATFRNIGANAAKNFSVVLFANNEAVDTVVVSDELASLATTSVVLDLPVKITEQGPLSVYAKVVYANDQKDDDDATETKQVAVAQPTVPAVSDLAAGGTDGNVTLTWGEPATPEAETVTEGFEDYDDFVTEFGDWTTYDGQPEAVTGGFSSSYTAHGQGEHFAYEIFNGETVYDEFSAVETNPGFAAHTGDKFAAVPYKYDSSDYVDGDEWLISPVLSGKAQTISFYAFNISSTSGTYNEQFEVLYSTDNTDISNFTKIGETIDADGTTPLGEGANWKAVSIDLPEGATYFAIRHVTSGETAFLFGIDDVTFEKGYDSHGAVIVGYNVYRDGELVGTVDASSKTYNDEGDGGEHVYNVTVIYQDTDGNRSESAFSNSVSVATGIQAIENALSAASYDVYTLDGRAVKLGAKSLEGLQKGVYIINDRKFILK